ncbi:PH domain-containing protein [Aeromonas enteropelogenes]|uniref:PH domain-containing protein n=1 Tax=Aeromonas enteropelogenes TaxID=29489 RepID=UPI00313735FB
MTYDIPWSYQNIAYATLLLFVLPLVITLGSEFIFTKKISLGVTLFSTVLSGSLLIIGILQITSSKVIVNSNSITLSSLMYTESINLKNIDSVSEIYDTALPESDKPTLRKNGIGLFGYSAGIFRFSDKKSGFVMMSTPPYLVVELKGENKKVIFSAAPRVHDVIKNNLISLRDDKSS